MATLIAEAQILRYALLQWSRRTIAPEDRHFRSIGTMGPVLIAILALSSIEIIVVDLIVSHFSRTAALIVMALGLFGFVYMLGVLKSLWLLPSIVTPTVLIARLGSVYELEVRRDNIAIAESLAPAAATPTDAVKLSGLSAPNVLLRFRAPVSFRKHLGKASPASAAAIHIDKADNFLSALQDR